MFLLLDVCLKNNAQLVLGNVAVGISVFQLCEVVGMHTMSFVTVGKCPIELSLRNEDGDKLC